VDRFVNAGAADGTLAGVVGPSGFDGQRASSRTLTIDHVSKHFGATHALADVSFTVEPGHIHGLLGGNGSGKSTLIKILAGVYKADAGEITFGGRSVAATDLTPAMARAAGFRFVHQNTVVFPDMSVADNIAIGNGYPTRFGRVSGRALRRRTASLLERVNVNASPSDLVGNLGPADQTMVAIARALQDEDADMVTVLVLDEPTASLPAQEVELLLAALRRCAALGQTILYVSHRIDEVLEITDRVTVLRDGRLITTQDTAGLTESALIEYIVGRPLDKVFPGTQPVSGTEFVLEIEGLRGGPLQDVSFNVRRGEIVGIAGLQGSGRTELLQMVFGSHPIDGGQIRLSGEVFEPGRPSDAMDRRVAYVPADREHEAAFPDLTVRENLSAARVGAYWRHGRFMHRRERDDAERTIGQFAIRADGESALFSSLSGGNQQKVVFVRWLRRAPELLLLNDPTQGVDVGARSDLYQWVRERADDGLSAVLVSSDFEELAQVASRVLILSDGRIKAELVDDEIDRQRITELVYASGEEAA
jgi:ribose transport system ATP-binding protein